MLEGTGYTTRLDKDRLLKIKDHFAKVRPALRRVRVEVHRRRDRDLRQPDPRRHDLQHGKPAQAAGGRRPRQGGAGRGAQGPQGRRLPAAGHAVQPDRRHAGRLQRADGPLQGADRRVRRPDARLLRRDDRPARPGGRRGRRQARQEAADHRPAGRPAQAGVGRAARRRRWPSRAATAPTRTCSPTPCSRRWPPSSSPSEPKGRRTSARTRPRAPTGHAARGGRQAGRRQGAGHERPSPTRSGSATSPTR